MHELALMEEVRRLAEERVAVEGAHRIHRLHLRVGSMAGVDPQALAFAFEVVMQGGAAEGATLRLEVVPTACFCGQCGEAFTPSDVIFACPRCGTLSRRILRGQELELASLEIS
ncbi:MAG: hydrogenase maturation nickel metallochaperone HypA [Synechococcaceae cyanobacterium ELA445]